MQHRIDPPEAADRLLWASLNGFTTHVVGDPHSPEALVLVRFWPAFIDVAHLRGADRTEVARIPRDERANIWRPERVTWHYYGFVVDALTALQHLAPPDAGYASHGDYGPPRGAVPEPLTVTDAERSKVTVRPPARRAGEGVMQVTNSGVIAEAHIRASAVLHNRGRRAT